MHDIKYQEEEEENKKKKNGANKRKSESIEVKHTSSFALDESFLLIFHYCTRPPLMLDSN